MFFFQTQEADVQAYSYGSLQHSAHDCISNNAQGCKSASTEESNRATRWQILDPEAGTEQLHMACITCQEEQSQTACKVAGA